MPVSENYSATERLRDGRGELLAELRPAYPVFVRFAGIDYDDEPDAVSALDDFVRAAQRIMAGYGGNLLQLTLGDKGAYLYGVFGTPFAHEDDAARAAAAALDLRDLEASTAVREIQIGIAHGRIGPQDALIHCLGARLHHNAQLKVIWRSVARLSLKH